jgi:hypothetical protein
VVFLIILVFFPSANDSFEAEEITSNRSPVLFCLSKLRSETYFSYEFAFVLAKATFFSLTLAL